MAPAGKDKGHPAVDDEAGFTAFYRATYSQIVGQVYPILGTFAEAEEVAQEAFSRAATHWAKVSTYDRPDAWVRRVAVNLSMSLSRRTRRRAAALLGLAREPVVEADPLNRLALVEALNKLPPRYRVVLTMHYLVDLPIRDVADELGLPVATVRTRLARGRRRLNEELSLEIVPGVPTVTEVFRA